MGKEALGRLLNNDNMLAMKEEAVWVVVARWRVELRRARSGGSFTVSADDVGGVTCQAAGIPPAEDMEWM